MANLVIVFHILTAVAVVVLILLQQGKGAEMGASFGGGASQTLFGSAGSGNFFSRLTGILAAVFFVTSFYLAVMAKQSSSVDDDLLLPSLTESEAPAALDLNTTDGNEAMAGSDVEAPSAPVEAADSSSDGDLPQVPAE